MLKYSIKRVILALITAFIIISITFFLVKSLGIKETQKANILGQYFDIQAILINDPITKKRDSGFEIVKKKK